MPGWRNWQTRRTQNPVLVREWEFNPPSGHHQSVVAVWGYVSMGFLRFVQLVDLRESITNSKQLCHLTCRIWVAYSPRVK